MTVDIASYCNPRDIDKFYQNIISHIKSHNYTFNKAHLIHQRCDILNDNIVGVVDGIEFYYHQINEEDYDNLLLRYNINPNDEEADYYTHGWEWKHFYKHHCVNHLKAFEVSNAKYIVMADADCYMKTSSNWIDKAIDILEKDRSILVVSPNEGSSGGKTQIMSQQLFLCERERLKNINFGLSFEGFREGGPFQEYYWLIEGRIGRYMEKNNLYRYILSSEFKYWHLQW